MRYRRLLALLVLILMLPLTQSCGRIIIEDISSAAIDTAELQETQEQYTPESVTVTEYDRYSGGVGKNQMQKYLDELGGADCGGASVYIAASEGELIFPDEGGVELSRSAIERNTAVEELINVRLVSAAVNCNTVARELEQSSLAGKGRYDILLLPLNEIGRFAVEGLLLDLEGDVGLETDRVYFNSTSTEASTFNGAVYAIAGDATLVPTEFPALYFNKELLRDAGVSADRIYSSVLKGEWTWDELLVYIEAVGVLEQYNTLTSQSMAELFDEAVFISSGRSYLQLNEDGVAQVGYDPDSAAAAVERLRTVMSDPTSIISAERSSIGDFASGRTAFAVEYIYVMSWLVNSEASWGVVPLPKNSEKGDYRSVMAQDAPLMAVPTVCRDNRVASVVISALNAASEGYIHEPFIENALVNVLHDNDSANMLEVIFDSAVFDRAVTYDERFPSLLAITELVKSGAEDEDWTEIYSIMAKEANKILEDELPIYIVEEEDPPETDLPETAAPETKPVETTAPETKPAETTAPETKPAETAAPETKPAETTAPETKPVETAAPETKTAETAAPETKPAETKTNN